MKFLLLIGYTLLFLRTNLDAFSDTPLYFLSNLIGALILLTLFYTRRKLISRKIMIGMAVYTFASLYIFFVSMFSFGIYIMNESSFIILTSMLLHFLSLLYLFFYPIVSLSQVIQNFNLYDTVMKRLVHLHIFAYVLSGVSMLSALLGSAAISDFYPYVTTVSAIIILITAFWVLIRFFFRLDGETS